MFVAVEGRLRKSTAHSVGYDLFATESVLIPPQTHAVVGTGVRCEFLNCFGVLFDRSGLAAKFGVSRMAGLIDPDYTDEIKVVLGNLCGREAYQVNKGDRIAQIVFFPLSEIHRVRVGGEQVEVVEEERKGGFGSTGG